MDDFKKWQDKFYHSKKWRDLRKECLLDNSKKYNSMLPVCEHCKKRIKRKGMQRSGFAYADHIMEINNLNKEDEKIILDKSNIQILCFSCHNVKTFGTPINDFDLNKRKKITLF